MTDPNTLPRDIKEKLLNIRDTLIQEDISQAYHILYSIADPYFIKMNPWAEMEHSIGYKRRSNGNKIHN